MTIEWVNKGKGACARVGKFTLRTYCYGKSWQWAAYISGTLQPGQARQYGSSAKDGETARRCHSPTSTLLPPRAPRLMTGSVLRVGVRSTVRYRSC